MPYTNYANTDSDEEDLFEGRVLLTMVPTPTDLGDELTLVFTVTNNTERRVSGRFVVARSQAYLQAVEVVDAIEGDGGQATVTVALHPTGQKGVRDLPKTLKVMFDDTEYDFALSLSTFANDALRSSHPGFKPTIGVVGAMGAGKSSLVNGVLALMTKPGSSHANGAAVGGNGARSLTQHLTDVVTPHFTLNDTFGVTLDEKNWKERHMALYLTGELTAGTSEEAIARMDDKKLDGLKTKKAAAGPIVRKDTVIFVMPASYLAASLADSMVAKALKVFGQLREHAPIVAVTQADTQFATSAEVEANRMALRLKAAELLGIPAKHVFIVVNYTTEDERNFEQDLQLFELVAAAIEYADERRTQDKRRGCGSTSAADAARLRALEALADEDDE